MSFATKLKNGLSTMRALGPSGSLALAASIVATPAFASGGQTIGALGNIWNTYMNSLGRFVLNIFMLTGIYFAGSGFMEMKRAGSDSNQGRDSHRSGFIKLLSGSGLTAITGAINVGTSSIFGGGSGSTSLNTGTVTFGG
mgnify:CR=1 FL=1